jgi:parallel beta-helix repeat protein
MINDTTIDGVYARKITVAGGNNITIRNITYSDGDPITLIFTNNSRVENNTVTNNNAAGFFIAWSHYNRFINNSASNNKGQGFRLYMSTHSNITKNIIYGNGQYGINFGLLSSNNTIYNNYFNNTNNAWDDGINIWNITKTSGTNIIGGQYLGGNYWRDYTGIDADGDGLGNTPYDIPGGTNKDYLPLVPAAAKGDFDEDGDVDFDDFVEFAGAYGTNVGDPTYDASADFDDDDDVDFDDFVEFAGVYTG